MILALDWEIIEYIYDTNKKNKEYRTEIKIKKIAVEIPGYGLIANPRAISLH
jgi:hypothetical protein